MSQDRVVSLRKDVVDLTLDGIRRDHPQELRGCSAITIDREGNYSYSTCGMSPEEMLASAEMLRETAMQILLGGDE